jgi:hypothetical protein
MHFQAVLGLCWRQRAQCGEACGGAELGQGCQRGVPPPVAPLAKFGQSPNAYRMGKQPYGMLAMVLGAG